MTGARGTGPIGLMRAALHLFVLIVLVAAAGCAPRLSPPGLALQQPMLGPDEFVTADGAILPMRAWLPDDQTPKAVIVALHGFNDYSNAFAEPATYFAQQGIATFAYDQRGFGSAPNRGLWAGVEGYVGDLRSVVAAMRARFPGVPLYVLGESMGGAVAMVAATSERPPQADGYILSAPAIWARETMPAYQTAALWLAAHTLPWMTLTGRGLKIQASDNIPMLRALSRDPLVIKETRIDAIWGLTNLMDRAFEAARHFDAPALILYGERDEVIPADPFRDMLATRAAAARAHQRVAFYDTGWHMLLRDLQAHVVWMDIVAWIENSRAALPSQADEAAPQARLSRAPFTNAPAWPKFQPSLARR